MDARDYARLLGRTFDREAALVRLEASLSPYAGSEAMQAVGEAARRWLGASSPRAAAPSAASPPVAPAESAPRAALSLAKFMARVGDVYSIPAVVARLRAIVRDPQTSAQELSNAIAGDVALAAKVLRVVNSSYFGFARRVASLKTAIVILGFNRVHALVVGLGTLTALGAGGRRFPSAAFWRHSVAAGVFAEAMLAEEDRELRDEGFAAGLLHDIGKLLLAQELPDLWAEVCVRTEAGGGAHAAERAVLGFDHADVGAALARAWGYPEVLIDAIGGHHGVRIDSAGGKAAAAVQVSDACVRACGIGMPEDGAVPCIEPCAWEALALRAEKLDRGFAGVGFAGELLDAVGR